MSKIVVSNLIGLAGDCELAIPFLFDVDTVVRRRMYGANQVIENQWGAEDTDRDDKIQVKIVKNCIGCLSQWKKCIGTSRRRWCGWCGPACVVAFD